MLSRVRSVGKEKKINRDAHGQVFQGCSQGTIAEQTKANGRDSIYVFSQGKAG